MEKQFISILRGGQWYKLFRDGKIQKPDGYTSDGKSWEFVGFVERLPFGRLGPIIPRKECFSIPEKDFKFKNGEQKYRVVDRDHGTLRVWM